MNKALAGDAKRKYFEHAGALMTADGTDDELIKLERGRRRATSWRFRARRETAV